MGTYEEPRSPRLSLLAVEAPTRSPPASACLCLVQGAEFVSSARAKQAVNVVLLALTRRLASPRRTRLSLLPSATPAFDGYALARGGLNRRGLATMPPQPSWTPTTSARRCPTPRPKPFWNSSRRSTLPWLEILVAAEEVFVTFALDVRKELARIEKEGAMRAAYNVLSLLRLTIAALGEMNEVVAVKGRGEFGSGLGGVLKKRGEERKGEEYESIG
ncbi:hypothetical protein DFP72DRAFT_852906 [Ephemerocybe angulata]|uniref:Uncharacterized protein n=1 Tax=Ephemerocybe angulata TaxID=980116 RepID=A0A8H6HMA0_9AGAR|nr:hypothetical protein DFP72DRAFT_852906 [Tulosesus angulatus]